MSIKTFLDTHSVEESFSQPCVDQREAEKKSSLDFLDKYHPEKISPPSHLARLSEKLDTDCFRQAVAMLPLVSIDLLLQDEQGRYLLGWRTNPPAIKTWFVPGGRIRKNETQQQALKRLIHEELGLTSDSAHWHFKGVYEHFYDVNFANEAGSTTHYVVLAYHLQLPHGPLNLSLPTTQHQYYRWISPHEACADADVHPYTKHYFMEQF